MARLAKSNSEPHSPTAMQVGPWSDFIVVSSELVRALISSNSSTPQLLMFCQIQYFKFTIDFEIL